MVAVYNSPQHKILAVNEFDILMLKADRSDMSVSRGYMLRSGCLPTSAWVVMNSYYTYVRGFEITTNLDNELKNFCCIILTHYFAISVQLEDENN